MGEYVVENNKNTLAIHQTNELPLCCTGVGLPTLQNQAQSLFAPLDQWDLYYQRYDARNANMDQPSQDHRFSFALLTMSKLSRATNPSSPCSRT